MITFSDISISVLAHIPYSQLDEGERISLWTYLITAVVALLAFIYLLYVTIRIIKLVGS